MVKQIILGLLFVWVWLAMTYYSAQIVNVMGRSSRAEKNLWWTRNAIVLFGFWIMVLWVLFMFWVLWTSSPTDMVTTDLI
jgi:hypothetical protein